MPFQKGQSGNPSGRQRVKPFREALDRAIAQDDGKRIRKAADKLLDSAADGEPWAIQMLADRLDGKALQVAHVETVTHVNESVQDFAAWLAEALGREEDSSEQPSLPDTRAF
jgi:hypothetical protein